MERAHWKISTVTSNRTFYLCLYFIPSDSLFLILLSFRYKGEWVRDVKQGRGLMVFATGTTYEGLIFEGLVRPSHLLPFLFLPCSGFYLQIHASLPCTLSPCLHSARLSFVPSLFHSHSLSHIHKSCIAPWPRYSAQRRSRRHSAGNGLPLEQRCARP